MSRLRALGVALTVLAGAGAAPAQGAALLTERLARLDTDGTDWVLFRDVCDKVGAAGSSAIGEVEAAVDRAGQRSDRRFSVRLLGVLARLDDRGVERLRALVVAEDARIATFAARVLGRCGATTPAARGAFAELLAGEQRPWVASAIAMGAADAGVSEAAPAILAVLRERELDPGVAIWFANALARVAGDVDEATVAQWLRAPAPLRDAGVLAARWHRAPVLERLLIGHLVDAEKAALARIAASLAACGGEAAVRALRDAVEADAPAELPDGVVFLGSSEVDARLLALARLREPAALAWMRGMIEADGRAEGRPTFEVMTPDMARFAELFGKWRCPGAAELLHERLRTQAGHATSRGHAARGLCWQRDLRGLVAAAALLVDPATTRLERGMGMALPLAQRTLHDFVADADRPDYVVLDDHEERAAAVGAAWQRWLERKGAIVQWREPLPDDDFLLWR